MRLVVAMVFVVGVGVVTACGAKEPPRVENAPAPTSASPPADEGNRHLDKSECEALAKWMLDACENRGNTHSSQIDRWCSNLMHRITGDANWVEQECMVHIRHIDSTCFHSTQSVRNLMDCESTISHPEAPAP